MDGISHLTFLVVDLDRMARFMCEGLGAVEVYDSNGKNFSLSREKFLSLVGSGSRPWRGHRRQSEATNTWRSAFAKKTCRTAASDLSISGLRFFHPVLACRVRGTPCMSMTSTTTCLSCIPAHLRSASTVTPVSSNVNAQKSARGYLPSMTQISVAAFPHAIEVSPELKTELEVRLADFERNPEAGYSWDQVKAHLKSS